MIKALLLIGAIFAFIYVRMLWNVFTKDELVTKMSYSIEK